MTNTSSLLEHQIREATGPVRALVAGLVPEDVPLPFAAGVLGAFIELERFAAAGRVLMAARAAESNEWQRAGCPSPSAWLALQQGSSAGRARADLATSGRLGGLPVTAGEVRAGNLSAEQAGVVADGATVNPAAERDLLDAARGDSLRHAKEEAARRKAEVEAEADKVERERKAHRERTARWWTKGGRWRLYLEGPVAGGAMVQQGLENRVGEIFRARRAGVREGRDQYAYDAVMDALGGVAGGGSEAASASTTTRRVPVKRLMLVRVDLSALINGFVGEGEVCEIPGVGAISVDAARRMFGDSVLRLITTNREAVVDVVNPSRQLTAAQQIARLWTDPKCVVVGCNRTVRLEFEHRVDFARSKRTVLVDTEHMCDHDHDLKTYGNWQLGGGAGRRAFVPPDDPRHPDNQPGAPHAPTGAQVPMQEPVRRVVSPELVARARRAREKVRRRDVPAQGDLFDTG